MHGIGWWWLLIGIPICIVAGTVLGCLFMSVIPSEEDDQPGWE